MIAHPGSPPKKPPPGMQSLNLLSFIADPLNHRMAGSTGHSGTSFGIPDFEIIIEASHGVSDHPINHSRRNQFHPAYQLTL
jgi:hypothetical protein